MNEEDTMEDIEERLLSVKKQIDSLKARAISLKQNMKQSFEREVGDLSRKIDGFQSRFDEARKLGQSAWEHTKQSFKSGIDGIRVDLKSIVDKFKT